MARLAQHDPGDRRPLAVDPADGPEGKAAARFRGLSVHGYWLNRWLASTPRETAIRSYRELAVLVANGTLAAPVEATYALGDYREAIDHPTRSDRHGKVLFTF